MLRSFHIENFRTFRQLSLPSLGQINLIVGRNNTGKTMLLEAVRLHSAQGSPAMINELLLDRDEVERYPRHLTHMSIGTVRLESIFHRRQPGSNGHSVIRLGPVGEAESLLTIKPVRLHRKSDARGYESDWAIYEPKQPQDAPEVAVAHTFGLAVSYGQAGEKLMPAETFPDIRMRSPFDMYDGESRIDTSAFVPPSGLAAGAVSSLWDAISLTDAEQRVAACLRIIAPIQRLSLVERPGEGRRMAVVKLEGEPEPVPLRSLGDGVRKIFDFALALEAARSSKILLIDEIENGIHYSALEGLWRFIITTATQAGVQVFATTHSWDCVTGFQAAVAAQPESTSPLLIRLYRDKKDEVHAVPLEREDIAVATRDHIEIR